MSVVMRSFWLVALLTILPRVSQADPLQLLACTEVHLLGPGCEEGVESEADIPAARPEPPLFTPQTMRPDTPPLLLQVFNDPSDANIQAYLAWEQRYFARVFAVDAKLKQARQERKR